jgi:hypothetical protein
MYRGIVAAGMLAAGALGLSAEGSGAGEAVTFRVRVENVSKADTLKTSMGSAPAAVAPVLYVVHTTKDPLFTNGQRDRSKGLERLAEEGNPSALVESLKGAAGISAVGAQDTTVGASAAGPIVGGHAYEFTVTAAPGARLTLAMMFGQSNDLFYAPGGEGIALFKNGKPVTGDITSAFQLWDAGTEVNQEPGVGPDQAPRQKAPNTGAAENGFVFPLKAVRDGFKYPAVGDVLKITIAPAGTGTV